MIRTAFKIHRWIGVWFGFATFLAFVSGLTLHWHTYSFPTEQEIIRGYGAPLTAAEVAGIRVPAAGAATLRRLNQRLVWEISPAAGEPLRLLDAKSGDTISAISDSAAARVAARVVDNAGSASTRLIEAYDHFYWLGNPPLPAYRVSFTAPRHVDVYVAVKTGAVTAVSGWREKVSDLLGEKVHYLKIGPLRTVTTPRFVIMGAFATLVLTGGISGLLYGLPLLFRKLTRAQRWGGALRTTHNLAGATVGLFIVMWGTTSYLMLWYPTMDPSAAERARVSGTAAPAEFRLSPQAAIVHVQSPVFALRATALLDRPVYVAIHGDGSATMLDAQTGAVLSTAGDSLTRAIVTRYLGATAPITSIARLSRYDEYYHATHDGRGFSFDGNPRPLPVYRVDLGNGIEPSPIYIRADRGEIVGRVGADYRAFRWLGSGVHDLDFPVLFQRRPRLWNMAILLPVLIGLVASASGVWLGARHLAQTFARRPLVAHPPQAAKSAP